MYKESNRQLISHLLYLRWEIYDVISFFFRISDCRHLQKATSSVRASAYTLFRQIEVGSGGGGEQQRGIPNGVVLVKYIQLT